MKQLLLIFSFFVCSVAAQAQISITSSDMPVSGDTLRYSFANPIGSTINLGDSGASFTWNYSSLTPIRQSVDTYKTALAVNILYGLISLSAYGYKVADTLPGGSALPVSVTQVYTFFEKKSSPSTFSAVAFAAKIAGVPTPFNYTKDDNWYYFPLNYGNTDSSNYSLNISLSSLASLKQAGYRKTHVDGWGTITTPFFTTPVNCIRVRSEIHEIDSVSFGGFPIGFPRNSVEYKWLATGQHYPILWVTTNVTATTEQIVNIRYRDMARTIVLPNEVAGVTDNMLEIKASPVPALSGIVTLDIPASWKQYHVDVLDINSKRVLSVDNVSTLVLESLPTGNYFARITSGSNVAYVRIVR